LLVTFIFVESDLNANYTNINTTECEFVIVFVGMLGRVAAQLTALIGWAYKAIQPPLQKSVDLQMGLRSPHRESNSEMEDTLPTRKWAPPKRRPSIKSSLSMASTAPRTWDYLPLK